MASSYQSGILNRPPEHNLVVALQFAGPTLADPTGARAAIDRLRDVVHKELRSQLDPEDPSTDKQQPGPETGELGFRSGYDRAHLTITFGISSSGFDRLGIDASQRPQDLIPIPWDRLGDSPVNPASGDCILQICSDDL